MPLLRDLQDRHLAIIGAKPRHKILEPLLGRLIRVEVIEENWDDIVRLAASIKAGSVAPSVMLKTLSAFKRQNRLDMALARSARSSGRCSPWTGWKVLSFAGVVRPGLTRARPAMRWAKLLSCTSKAGSLTAPCKNQEHRASGSIW